MQPYSMQDIGCTIRSAIAAAAESGSCLERLYPYESYHVNRAPPATCYSEGRRYCLTRAEKVNANVNEMKACLAEGFPIVFGLKTFQSFAKAQTNGGVVYMPQSGEAMSAQHGWHAMLASGYSDSLQAFIVRNSWGATWVRCSSFHSKSIRLISFSGRSRLLLHSVRLHGQFSVLPRQSRSEGDREHQTRLIESGQTRPQPVRLGNAEEGAALHADFIRFWQHRLSMVLEEHELLAQFETGLC